MRVLVRILTSCAAVALASCAYGPSGGRVGETGQVQVVASTSLPEPTLSDTVNATRDYHIGALDLLVVDVLGIEEMTNREIAVDSSGRISVPMAGSIVAAGKTPEQLAELITARLKEGYVRDPMVTVNVKEPLSQYVTVDGEVL